MANSVLATLAILTLAADDRAELSQALAKAATLESYSFKSETEVDSPLGNAPPTMPRMDGKFKKGVGVHIVTERGEAFKRGDKVVFKPKDGEWQDGGQFQAPSGKDAAKQQRATIFGRLMLRAFKAPHEEVQELAKGFKDVQKDPTPQKFDGKDMTVYKVDLSDEAMKASPFGKLATQFGQATEVKGTGRFFVDADGRLAMFETVTRTTVDFQGNVIEFTMTRRNELSAGDVALEIPAGAAKLMDVQPTPPATPTDK